MDYLLRFVFLLLQVLLIFGFDDI